jgi:hypothetical protein
MMPLEVAALALFVGLPFHWMVLRHFRRLADPQYLRRHGVVVQAQHVLQAHSAPIGEYMGRPIWASVTFMGMEYRFDRTVERRRRDSIGPRELFLEPGLVYVTA